MSESALVELRNVTKVYPMPAGDVYALNDVSFTVNRGEFIAIMGP